MRIESNAARILYRLAQGTCSVAMLSRSNEDRHNTHFVLRQLKHAGCVRVSLVDRVGWWNLTPSGQTLVNIVDLWDSFNERQDNALRARIRDKRPKGRGRDWKAKVKS